MRSCAGRFTDLHFGVHTGLQNTNIAELTRLWQRSESHGFEWISIWDHFYAADGTGNAHSLEAVASHAALAASTARVRCGSLVYSAGYRHPAVLANAMATLDQIADGWNVPFIAPDAFAHKVEALNRHCETADRDPSTITRAINVGIAFQEEDLHAQYGKMADFVCPGVLTGSVAEMCDRVGAYREAGAEWLMLSLRSPFDIEGLDRFAAEVLPALK